MQNRIVDRFRSYLRMAIDAAHREDPKNYCRWAGVCEGQVAVLYDFNHPNRFKYLSALRRLQKLVDRKVWYE